MKKTCFTLSVHVLIELRLTVLHVTFLGGQIHPEINIIQQS